MEEFNEMEDIENINIEVENTKMDLAKAHRLMDELKSFGNSNVGLLFESELNLEYQRLFKLATTEDDAHKCKGHLDRMKGVGFAMGVVRTLQDNLEDDIKNLRDELEYQEAGKE